MYILFPTVWEGLRTRVVPLVIIIMYMYCLIELFLHSIQAKLTPCKVCEMEPCLALSLQAVPTVSPIQPITDSSLVNHENLAVNQLLCDMEGLVGSSLLSDVQIQAQSGSIIPAHAVILAARCTPLREVSLVSYSTMHGYVISSPFTIVSSLSLTHTHTDHCAITNHSYQSRFL